MREIKFRAWDGSEMIYLPSFTLCPKEKALTGRWEIMQFTGLLDKNGKEIFENDVVLVWGQSKAKVIYRQSGFCLEWNDDSNIDLLGWYSFKRGVSSVPSDFEIIGNIYENPELIA
jgi:uncharacterized phage protein (TIGR01671 family)